MNKLRHLSIIILLLFIKQSLYAQVKPKVLILKNKQTESTLPSGVLTNLNNNQHFGFSNKGILVVQKSWEDIEVRHIGFYGQKFNLSEYTTDTLTILLSPDRASLKTVDISGKRYRNKNNPAVELIKKVVEHRPQNQPHKNHKSLSYSKYEKFNNGFMTPKGVIPSIPFFKKLDPLFQNFDTTIVEGAQMTPLLLMEDVFLHYKQSNPKKEHEIHLGNKQIRFDKRYISNEHTTQALKYLYDDLDIYDPELELFARKILSPISSMGPTFYKYYIEDTLHLNTDNPLIQLRFEPRAEKAVLFNGVLSIQLKDYAIKDAEIYISPDANVNFIEESKVNLYYQNFEEENYIEEIYSFTKVSMMPGADMVFYFERSVFVDNMEFNKDIPDSVYSITLHPDSIVRDYDQEFWEKHRSVPLTEAEEQQYETFDSLNKTTFFKRLQDIGSFIFTGYKQVGSWEIGNLNTFYSHNSVDGSSFRIGGRSTPRFSKNWYMAGHVGYGLKSENWRYGLEAIRSFSKTDHVFRFPQNFLQFNYYNDIRFPGQDMEVLNQYSLAQNIRFTAADRILYNRRASLAYVRDWSTSLQTRLALRFMYESPGGILALEDNNANNNKLGHYQYYSSSLNFTWAPKQQALQQKDKRTILPNRLPVLRGELEWAPQFIDRNDYNFLRWNLSVSKRTFLGPFGKFDAQLNYGGIKGVLPYTLLFTPSTNTTFFFDRRGFNLLNYSELVGDEYLHFNLEWQLDGFFFNRIPYFNSLRLREAIGFNLLAGNLSPNNNPNHNHLIPAWPLNEDGEQFINPLVWNNPYMEMSFGITNILKIFRVDYIMRLSHLQTQNKFNHGVKFNILFSL